MREKKKENKGRDKDKRVWRKKKQKQTNKRMDEMKVEKGEIT